MKRFRLKTKHKVLVIFLLAIIVIAIFCINVANPIILMYTEGQVTSIAAKTINSAISEVLTDYIVYEDFIKITRNNAGEIVLIEANAIEMNRLAKKLISVAQNRLELISDQGLMVPLGTFTGIPLFIGRGPDVRLSMAPVGTIQSSFESKFETMGINTTNHRIYINIDISISVALPIQTKVLDSTQQVLFCENVIVGEVPSTYLNSNRLEHMLNLVP